MPEKKSAIKKERLLLPAAKQLPAKSVTVKEKTQKKVESRKDTPEAKVKNARVKKELVFTPLFVSVIAVLCIALGAAGFYTIQTLTKHEKTPQLTESTEENKYAIANEGEVLSMEKEFTPTYLTPPPEVSATSYKIMRSSNGNNDFDITMYSKNADLTLAPASLTKIMTALIAMEDFSLDKEIVVPPVCTANNGSLAGFKPNEILSLQDMLYGLLVSSGADAACSIAHAYGREKFINQMNQKANELGLENTVFVNEVGFDSDSQQLSSVNDLTKITKEALKYDTFKKIVGTPQYTVAGKYKLYNTNDLLDKIPGTVGIKTGYTEDAGGCLIYLYEDPQTSEQILITLLGSTNQSTRFSDTKLLLDWAKDQIKQLNQ